MLLSNLSLGYELLADDPIETSIHYGESILNFMTGKIQTAVGIEAKPKTKANPVNPQPQTNHVMKQFISYSRPVSPRTANKQARLSAVPTRQVRVEPAVAKRQSTSYSQRYNLRSRRAMPQTRTVIGVI